jgi:hypothetical protein
VWHRLRIVLTLLGPVGCVVVHLPATGAVTRAALLVLAALAVRDRYLVWVDVDPEEALHGQRSRGRVLRRRCFRRHARRGAAFGARLRAGYRPRGWRRVLVLDRGQAREGVVLAGGS